MASWLYDMFIWLGFNPKEAKLLIREQGLDSPKWLRVLMDKNIDEICNLMRKPYSKNVSGLPNMRQQVSVLAKNSNPAAFLFHHRWRCISDREVARVDDDMVHLLAGQKSLEDDYKGPDVLPKINKSDIAGTMEAIKE